MHAKFARGLYFSVQDFLGVHVRARLRWLEETQWWPAEELKRRQWEALKRTLRHAYQHVPYYRATWDALKLHPDDIQTHEDFQQLPVLTKQAVRDHAQELRTQRARGRILYRLTSGSTGVPLCIAHDVVSRAAIWAAKYRGHRWHGIDVGEKVAWVWGTPSRSTAAGLTQWAEDRFMNRLRLFPHEISAESVTAFYRRLKRGRPPLLYGYPVALHQLAKFIVDLKLDARALGLRLVLTGAEVLHAFQRTYLEQVFGCQVVDEYGCNELGILAFPCAKGRRHVIVENVYLEVLPSTPDLGTGAGEILVTGLVNDAMPLIRYRLGDVGMLGNDHCPCDRAAPVLGRIDGRNCQLMKTTDGRWLHNVAVSGVISELERRQMGVDRIRFTQEQDASLTVDVVRGQSFNPGAVAYIQQAVKDLLGQQIAVHFRFVEQIPLRTSGKFSYFVSNLPECVEVAERLGGAEDTVDGGLK